MYYDRNEAAKHCMIQTMRNNSERTEQNAYLTQVLRQPGRNEDIPTCSDGDQK